MATNLSNLKNLVKQFRLCFSTDDKTPPVQCFAVQSFFVAARYSQLKLMETNDRTLNEDQLRNNSFCEKEYIHLNTVLTGLVARRVEAESPR